MLWWRRRAAVRPVHGSAPRGTDPAPAQISPAPVKLEITDVLDLHTFAPLDVKDVVEAYLEEAHAAGFRQVRIIHGKGIGVQRELAQDGRLEQPVLIELRGQFDEIARDIGAGDQRIGHVRQQAVQAMSELVEQGTRVVHGQQRRQLVQRAG